MPDTPGSVPGSLSVILPAYHEADNLRLLLPALRAAVSQLTPDAEILVVDAAPSLDATPQVCAENGVRHLPRQGGNNYGDAIRTGIAASRGDYILVMDSDGSHQPDFIPQLWARRAAAEVVIASRYVPGGHTDNPWLLVTMSQILNRIFELIVGLPVLDVSNSFRLYHGDRLRRLSLTYLHFDVLEEILVKLLWDSTMPPIRIVEIPYHFAKRQYGKSKRNLLVFGFRFLLALYRLRKIRSQHIAEARAHLAAKPQ